MHVSCVKHIQTFLSLSLYSVFISGNWAQAVAADARAKLVELQNVKKERARHRPRIKREKRKEKRNMFQVVNRQQAKSRPAMWKKTKLQEIDKILKIACACVCIGGWTAWMKQRDRLAVAHIFLYQRRMPRGTCRQQPCVYGYVCVCALDCECSRQHNNDIETHTHGVKKGEPERENEQNNDDNHKKCENTRAAHTI